MSPPLQRAHQMQSIRKTLKAANSRTIATMLCIEEKTIVNPSFSA